MNELSTISKTDQKLMYEQMRSAGFPEGLVDLLRQYQDDLAIDSWADFERRFLLGTGKSKETIKTYMVACKAFFDFTGGLHPVQAGTPEWIEQYYDSLDKLDLNTKVLRMRSLKFMYKRIEEKYPFASNPFNDMDEKLNKKLFRSRKDEADKGALQMDEYRAILKVLDKDKSVLGRFTYGLFRFAVATGLRAHELCLIKWQNFNVTADDLTITFTGKGAKTATIQVEQEAYQACIKAFKVRFNRKPKPEDYVFNSLTTVGISKATIHLRMMAIADMAKKAGIMRQNLDFSTHTLRHTTASRLLELGVDLESLRKHMRHSSLATTQRYLDNRTDLREYWAKLNGEEAA